MIALLRRLLGVSAVHVYELELPAGQREMLPLYVRDSANLYGPGDISASLVIERVSSVRTRITIRNDDEVLSEHDLDVLLRPVPA